MCACFFLSSHLICFLMLWMDLMITCLPVTKTLTVQFSLKSVIHFRAFQFFVLVLSSPTLPFQSGTHPAMFPDEADSCFQWQTQTLSSLSAWYQKWHNHLVNTVECLPAKESNVSLRSHWIPKQNHREGWMLNCPCWMDRDMTPNEQTLVLLHVCWMLYKVSLCLHIALVLKKANVLFVVLHPRG